MSQVNADAQAIEREDMKPLSTWTRISYGFGDTACNIVFGMISTLLTLFYTDYAGVPVATVGLVMLLSRIFDGSSDLIMGFIVNKTKSKYGKARPWIIWMAIPYCITAVALFLVPQSSESVQFWYIFVTYNLCTTVWYTAINVPFGTLSTLMTRSSHERDMLSIFRMSLAPCGRIIAVTFTMPVVHWFGNDIMAWVKTMSIWAAIAFILLLICFLNCKEVVGMDEVEQQKRSNVSIGQNLMALVSNQYFWSTLILWTVTVVHGAIVGTSLPYYCKYLFGDDNLYGTLYFAEAGSLILGAIFCPFLLRRFKKRDLCLWGSVVAVIGQALFILDTTSYTWALITSIIRALGEAPLTAVVFGMMGDVVEFGEWKTGIRQEALIFGGGSLGFKLGSGITSAILTSLLAGAGYVSSTSGIAVQPETALKMIENIYVYGPIIVWVIAVITLYVYKLDDMYDKIMADLADREKNKSDNQ